MDAKLRVVACVRNGHLKKRKKKKKNTHTHKLELVIMLIKNAINMKSVSKYDFSK